MAVILTNKWMKNGLWVLMSFIMPASSFSLNSYLSQQITANTHTDTLLNYAIAEGNTEALFYAWHHSEKYSDTWRELGVRLAKTEGNVAYQLAGFYRVNNLDTQAVNWYQRSMRLSYPFAYIALAQYYVDKKQWRKAARVLEQQPDPTDIAIKTQSNILTIKVAISLGKSPLIEHEISQVQQLLQTTLEGRSLLNNIAKYQVDFSSNDLKGLSPSCANSIQFFATNLPDLLRVESLIKRFESQTLNQYVCFAPVRYIAIDSLDCNDNSEQAIQCNEQGWQHLADKINTRFVGVMLPQGGANVHYGAIYIDAKDNLDVLVHEISHLLGFVDEYPLTPQHQSCQKPQQQAFSENIAILANTQQGTRREVRARVLKQLSWRDDVKDSTPILQAKGKAKILARQQWQLGTPNEYASEVGIFIAKTCLNSLTKLTVTGESFNAFKPLSQITKMQYFTLTLPDEYLSTVAKQTFRYLMPSFHYNIAYAHFQQDNLAQAKYWLKRAADWEVNDERRKRILQGDY